MDSRRREVAPLTKYLVHEQQFYKWINIYSNIQDNNAFLFYFMNVKMLKKLHVSLTHNLKSNLL